MKKEKKQAENKIKTIKEVSFKEKTSIFFGIIALAVISFLTYTNTKSLKASNVSISELSIFKDKSKTYLEENKNYSGFCKSNMVNDMEKKVKEYDIKSLDCREDGDEWAILAKLTNNHYYCIDSNGFSNQIKAKLEKDKTNCSK